MTKASIILGLLFITARYLPTNYLFNGVFLLSIVSFYAVSIEDAIT